MTIKKYAVIDEDGYKVNSILIDDEKLEGYYPGYGVALIDEGLPPPEPEKYVPPPIPKDFGVIDVVLEEPMRVGDKIDFETGEVTQKQEEILPIDELPVDEIPVDEIPVEVVKP